jgi:hypothetical protein
VLAAEPQIAWPCCSDFGRRRGLVCFFLIERIAQQRVDLVDIEPGEAEIELRILEFLQFQRE